MQRTVFNTITAIILGIIIAILISLTNGNADNLSEAAAIGLIAAVFTFALLTESISRRIKHLFCDLDWADEITQAYNNISATYRQSFWILFGLINLAYLFHTINFLWGGSDWAAVRTNVDINESLTDGRFSAFWLQELLFNGKILPVANNLWAFFGLSLAGVLLAIYWKLPQKTSLIVLSGLILAVNPYTLSWLYSAKNTLGCLWLPALVLGATLLAENKSESPNRTLAKNLISVMLYLIALGTYFPVINFIAVMILGKIFLTITQTGERLKDAMLSTCQSLANLTAALMFYVFILFLLEESGKLNTSYGLSTPFNIFWSNLPLWLEQSLRQFATPLPFADLGYQLLFVIMCVAAVFTLIFNTPNTRTAIKSLLLIPLLIIASKLSVLFTVDTAETTTYLAQINFFGLPLIYALLFIILAELNQGKLRTTAYILGGVLVFMSFVRVAYAQKVWKFGWDAETKLAERIITRLEKLPEFDIEKKYKLLQIGEMSLRQKYYLKQPNETANDNLLGKSYYPAGIAKDAYNFFYQTDFLSENATTAVLADPAIREYLSTTADVWPAKESLWIYGDYIILILDETALYTLRKSIER